MKLANRPFGSTYTDRADILDILGPGMPATTWALPNGEDVTSPLDPETFGFGIIWAEAQGDGGYLVVSSQEGRVDFSYLRVASLVRVEHAEYGTIWTSDYDTPVSDPDSVLPEWHGNIGGRGPRVDATYLRHAAAVLTVASKLVDGLNAKMEELSK